MLNAADRPNVLMFAVDDLRPMLGCYGDPRILTPNIDKLARRSIVFERAYCQYAKCGTSRLSLMTGLRPDSVGVFSNRDQDVLAFRKRRPDAKPMARWFKENGYHTQSFGKIYHDGWDLPEDWSAPSLPGRHREMWEIADPKNPAGPTIIAERLACPVMQSPDVDDDHFFAGRMTGEAIGRLSKPGQTKPFFLAVGYRRPHLPFVAPKRYFDLYQPDETWLPPNRDPPLGSPIAAWFNSDGYVGSAKRVNLDMPKRPTFQEAIEWNGYELRSYLDVAYHGEIAPPRQIELIHAYAACVSYVDAQIGNVLEHIDEANTIVVLWSDHGWHLGEMSAWGKMTNFEIATRVPLLVALPGSTGRTGGRTREIAELVDLYPTLCELAGLDAPAHLEGESLVAAIRDPEAHTSGFAISQYLRFQGELMGRAIRTDRYRYVAWIDQKSKDIAARELYDHSVDPAETRNLANDPNLSAAIGRLHEKLLAR